jgi:hypothetical protein
MRTTKLDMARVIATALYNAPELLPADHHSVAKLQRQSKNDLQWAYDTAVKILGARIA